MADVRNDQYLHRPGAGRGAITPADPLEVLLHSGGQPISGTNRLPVEATLSGRIDALRGSFVTGAKTVTSTAAEIFAGSNRLSGRHAMVIANVGTDHVFIGPSGVTVNNGFPLFPGDSIRIEFNPGSSVPIFAVSGGANVEVRVVELA